MVNNEIEMGSRGVVRKITRLCFVSVLLTINHLSLTTVSAQLVPPPLAEWCAAPVLKEAPAREAGMDSLFLFATVDSIVNAAISTHAFPGCQLFVARGGKVVIDRSYGWHDYSELRPVENHHLYDLASVTKVAAATMALMKLTEEFRIELDEPLSKHYRPFRGTDKKEITFREVLAHQSGLPAGIPMLRLMKSDALEKQEEKPKGKKKRWDELPYNEDCFRYSRSQQYPIEIYRDRYLNRKYRQMLLDEIRDAELREKKYRYSDLPFVLVPQVVEQVTAREFDEYLQKEFYGPMGLKFAFNPHETVPLEEIVPTENDEYFRYTTIHGWVHDESAAIVGGVSGNAGLFGSARDLGVMTQMLLNGGIYDGKRYLRPATIDEFTRVQYPDNENRRALGFDKPYFCNDTLCMKDAYPAPSVSMSSYGHSGFTGTFFWVDPEFELIYVLLTNRVNPSRDNKAFRESMARYTIQQAVYDAIRRFDEAQEATDVRDKADPSTAGGNLPPG